jgi:quinoprotein glucose dehydrogenase
MHVPAHSLKRLIVVLTIGLAACTRPPVVRDPAAAVEEWPSYGNDPGSSRYSPLSEITKANVGNLKVAWTYRTGDMSDAKGTWNGKKVWAKSTFEATPLMADGTLYIATPFNRIIALDAETGKEKWAFDPKLNRIGYYGDDFTCRGLARRIDPNLQPGQACRKTLYEATLDGRLIAVDAETGKACAAFGSGGEVSLKAGIKLDSGVEHLIPGEYHFTSAPAVVGDVVVVGSAINDNDRVEMPPGVVRGYDARSGALVWSWDPVPRDPADPARATWQNGADRTGAANVWGPISADPERDLVFLPTTSPSPDYYGGERKGANVYANSVVALRASTGKVVWSFQAVHHDLWDYDLPSAPSLIEVERGGKRIAALAQPTKMGHLFILDRDTGQPVLPVEERPVRQDGVPGEWLSPTQPFPVATPRLVPDRLEPADAWGLTPWDRGKCRDTIAGLRRGSIFTPPSLQTSLQYPGNAGGTNWGGVSFDRARGLIVLNQTNLAFMVQLIPRAPV